MKRALISLVIVSLVVLSAAVVMGQVKENKDYVVGIVVSIDRGKNEITISDFEYKEQQTFQVRKAISGEIKTGDKVMVTALKGSVIAQTVDKIE
jgi:hypothetical protein